MTTADVPAPFTTIDIDLSGMPGFMLDAEKLRQSELWALSSGDEFKAAVGLWCRAWQQKPPGSLPNDDRLLAAWSGAGKRWSKVRDMALRGFVLCSDGRLYHRVLCEDVLRAWERRQTFRERASKGGFAKGAKAASSMLQADSSPASSVLEPAQGRGRGQGQGSRQEEESPFESAPSTSPPPASPDRWRFEQAEPWATGLVAAGCKVGPKNWPAWKALVEKHSNELVLTAAAGVPADERWPDAVEKAITARGAQVGSIGDRVRAKTVRITT